MPSFYLHCHYMREGKVCPDGCHDDVFVCHHFSRKGECRFGDNCKRVHSHRSQNNFEGPNGAGPWSEHRRKRSPSRDGFGRPHTPPKRPRTSPVYKDPMARHRQTLGLNPDGINVAMLLIRAAYKVKCLECHPDKGGTAAGFRKIHEAFEHLKSTARCSESLCCRK